MKFRGLLISLALSSVIAGAWAAALTVKVGGLDGDVVTSLSAQNPTVAKYGSGVQVSVEKSGDTELVFTLDNLTPDQLTAVQASLRGSDGLVVDFPYSSDGSPGGPFRITSSDQESVAMTGSGQLVDEAGVGGHPQCHHYFECSDGKKHFSEESCTQAGGTITKRWHTGWCGGN